MQVKFKNKTIDRIFEKTKKIYLFVWIWICLKGHHDFVLVLIFLYNNGMDEWMYCILKINEFFVVFFLHRKTIYFG